MSFSITKDYYQLGTLVMQRPRHLHHAHVKGFVVWMILNYGSKNSKKITFGKNIAEIFINYGSKNNCLLIVAR